MDRSKPHCSCCGRFFKYETAYEYFEPDNHFGPEISEWICEHCIKKENNGA